LFLPFFQSPRFDCSGGEGFGKGKEKKGGKSDGRKDSPEITGGLFFLIIHREKRYAPSV